MSNDPSLRLDKALDKALEERARSGAEKLTAELLKAIRKLLEKPVSVTIYDPHFKVYNGTDVIVNSTSALDAIQSAVWVALHSQILHAESQAILSLADQYFAANPNPGQKHDLSDPFLIIRSLFGSDCAITTQKKAAPQPAAPDTKQ